ncbi:hypothetical protein HDK77DRAFT_132998 [Phyllosticta capitalensis]
MRWRVRGGRGAWLGGRASAFVFALPESHSVFHVRRKRTRKGRKWRRMTMPSWWKQKRKKEVAPLSHLFLPRTDAEWFSRNDPTLLVAVRSSDGCTESRHKAGSCAGGSQARSGGCLGTGLATEGASEASCGGGTLDEWGNWWWMVEIGNGRKDCALSLVFWRALTSSTCRSSRSEVAATIRPTSGCARGRGY